MFKNENFNALIELSRARLYEFVRDPSALFWVFVFPLLLAVVLGVAFRNKGPEVINVAIVGGSPSLIDKLKADTMKFIVSDERGARVKLKKGQVEIIVILSNENLGAKANKQPLSQQSASLSDERPKLKALPSVTYVFDPSRPNTEGIRKLVDDSLQRQYGRIDVLNVEEEKVIEKGGRYIDYLLPGLIGLNIMGSCMWGLGYAVVDFRRRKLLKRFAVTPIYRANFLIAFFFSRLAFLVLEVAALVIFGVLIFDMTIHGSIGALGVTALCGAFAFSGISLLIAARTESAETASGWMNFVQLPMWLLAGSFFSYTRFPEILHPFIRCLPLTALNDTMRAIVNDGASITQFALPFCVLGIWGTVSFVVALKIFKWQ